jgi:hypothetical protein
MFRTGDKSDFERMLDDLLERARTAAAPITLEVESQFIKAGGVQSSRLPIAIEQRITPIHEAALRDAMRLVVQFSEHTGIALPELCATARPKLAAFTEQMIERMVMAADRMHLTQAIAEFRQRFDGRVDHALRDVEIGFIQANSAIMAESQKSQTKALRLLKRIYDRTRSSTDPVFVVELGADAGLTEQESQAAWRYLKDKGLIETFTLPFTARINAAGIHAIEDAQRHPDQPVHAFPSVTYNIVNNTTNIGTATNSSVQQAGAQSTQKQVMTYGVQERTDLERLVSEFTNRLDELRLEARDNQKAKAMLATLQAQLTDEPDPIIVQQAGRTLRNITEGVIGSLIATGVQPTVWSWVVEVMARLFP